MCGVAGIVSADRSMLERALPAMTEAMAHRGPDDEGTALFETSRGLVGFGHRRLSIIDLSAEGHQPMVHPETGDALVYNGELYNFRELRRELEAGGARFRGHGDTEVLLHALVRFGPDALRRLAGMYALAFFERRTGRVLLARDPLGIKPLYVAEAAGALLFASEVRAILASGRLAGAPDPRAVAGYLAYGSVQEPLTAVEGVAAFPPGSWQWWDGADPAPPARHWDFPSLAPADPDGATGRTRELLDVAVRDHLVADVPVGVFLSSGLDSTIVASLAARHAREVRTFTVGFADQADMSEAAIAAGTARELGTRHTDISVTDAEALRLVERWLSSLDQPSLDGLNVFVISKVVKDAGITVALSGQGGDEMFGGYPAFTDVAVLRRVHRLVRWLPVRARERVLSALAAGRPASFRQKLADVALSDGGVADLYLRRRRILSERQLGALGVDAARLGLDGSHLPPDAGRVEVDEDDVVWSVSALESSHYLLNTLLRDGDANSMAHSLEIRVPMLDRRVLDFALALPGSVKLPSGRADKALLRRAFPDVLRPVLTSQAKRGFHLPLRRWMKGPLRDHCEASLSTLKASGLVRARGVDEAWNGYLREPESPIWSRAWALCVLGAWLGGRAPRGPGDA